jgi:hypothetical protein
LDRLDGEIREALERGAPDEIDHLLAQRELRLRELVRDAQRQDSDPPAWLPHAKAQLDRLLKDLVDVRDRVGAEWRELRGARQSAALWRDGDRPEARFLSRRA